MARHLPEGSSAFARTLADFNAAPIVVEVTSPDETDHRPVTPKAPSKVEEGQLVHGLHHCYKVEGGQSHPVYNCSHDHARVSQGHLEDIAKSANTLPSPQSPRRRLSIQMNQGIGLFPPDDDEFRQRSLSDASMKRRVSMPVGLDGNNLSPKVSPKASPKGSPKPARRNSVSLQSEQLHHVYNQFLGGKK